jgi:elongation factor 1-alpha
VYTIRGIGTVATGVVVTGSIKPNMQVCIGPDSTKSVVKSIEMHHENLAQAIPGDNIGINFKNLSFGEIRKGCVVSDCNNDPA